MKVQVHRNETSQAIVHEAENAYTKGNMYCVLVRDTEGNRQVHKYPLCSIFRVSEEY